MCAPRSRISALLLVASLATLPLSASAQLLGPTYPAPGGNSWSQSGPEPIYGWKTWSYSGLDHSAFDELYWGFFAVANPSTSFYPTSGSMNICGFGGSFINWCSSRNLNIQHYPYGFGGPAYLYSAPVRLEMMVTGAPVVSGVLGFPVVDLSNAAISSFSVQFRYLVATTGEYIGSLFDRLETHPYDRLITAASGGFFYTEPTVVPEPGTMLLLATGLLGLGVAARRRRRLSDRT